MMSVNHEEAAVSGHALSYAQLRMEKLRRNQALLAGLGLTDTAKDVFGDEKPNKPKRTTSITGNRKRVSAGMEGVKSDSKVRRRSPRLSGEDAPKQQLGDKSKLTEINDEEEEEPTYLFDTSKVLQYTCYNDKEFSRKAPSTNTRSLRPNGFNVADPLLKRIYSMNFHHIKPLLAAGGHGGRVALMSSTLNKNKPDELLLSFKASKGWISGVRFINQLECGLLVSSNDGSLSLWDCTVQHRMVPKCMLDGFVPHGGSGIFDMDLSDTQLVTSGKDGSLCLSTMSGKATFTVERSIEDAHAGVAKSVMFQPISKGSIVASGGNDSAIRVWDVRQQGNKPAVELMSSFGSVVNIVRWNPEVQHQLLSASFASAMELHDTRKPNLTPMTLQGHIPSGVNRVSNIYQPVFLNGGTRIVASGGGSHNLTMFDSSTGEVVSSGVVGWESGSLEPMASSNRLAVSHGMEISFFDTV